MSAAWVISRMGALTLPLARKDWAARMSAARVCALRRSSRLDACSAMPAPPLCHWLGRAAAAVVRPDGTVLRDFR